MSNNLVTIPLCQLKRANLNVRKTGRKADLEGLVASIEAHPIDTMAASSRGMPGQDEINQIATFRGEPLAVVKCLTNDIYVPADAEIVLEGYVDERGYIDN